MGSMALESKRCPYGLAFRLKPPTERFYTEYLSMASRLLGNVPPSHGDGQDFPDSRFVYNCQASAMGVNGSSFCGAWAQGYELYDKIFICLYYSMNIYLLTYVI